MNPSGPYLPRTEGAGPADYNGNHLVLLNQLKNMYQNEITVGQGADTSSWYKTNYGCLRTDPTRIARFHTFPDAVIPRGFPEDPAPPSRVCSDATCTVPLTSEGVGCTQYQTAWPQRVVDPNPMIETEMNHPQFAFHPGGPATRYQIDVESQLRRLDQPLTNCQAIIPEDAPLYRNTVAPPIPVGTEECVQNACNPVAAIVMRIGAEQCRMDADSVASAMSGRWINNPTRQDTMRFDLPFEPPGIGVGQPRPKRPLPQGSAFYA